MEHLKIFEYFNDMYKPISLDDTIEFNSSHNRGIFSDNEFFYLKKINWFNRIRFKYSISKSQTDSKIDIRVGHDKFIHIVKYNDDWFILQALYNGKIFKCDTFDGVKQCIKKEKLL